MNVWLVILLSIVLVAIVLYVLVAVVGVKSSNIIGPPLAIAILIVLFAGLSYYLLWEKSIHVVIEADDRVLQKRAINYNDDVMKSDDVFVFSSSTRGIHAINYKPQVEKFLAADDVESCQEYDSQTTGTGRYKKESGGVSICINKKGVRWFF